ncbi:PhnD/SsuA/transferrin family substrate-binding protein [Yoonia sp. 208BN28-4]|uniref:PhnD/SsuA/transferrin family substrate-binding protein n=1 Tax=Yoonia sp. 208BN28-4 TaxID=3126505 RepID=UPI0030A3FD74
MIASFPMYDRPSTRAGYDALWVLIRDNLRDAGLDAPDALDHEMPHLDTWAQDDLVLGQICNLPLRAKFAPTVTVIGTADYGLPDCPPGHYNTLFIVRGDSDVTDPYAAMQQRFVINDYMSQSGFGAAHQMAARKGIDLVPQLASGAHALSLRAVATGAADCASIDAQTWRHLCADDPLSQEVRVIGQTQSSPAMSLITAGQRDPAPYFAAIKAALAALPQQHQDAIGWRDIVQLPDADYALPIPALTQAVA